MDELVQKISDGLFHSGRSRNSQDTDFPAPDDGDFKAWASLFVSAMHKTYDPFEASNLQKQLISNGKPVERSHGYPLPDDIAAAYGVFRLLLRVTTEENTKNSSPPSISADISAAISNAC